MRVILLQDVDNLGKRWEVREVADGYARNVLLPRRLAALATQDAVQKAEAARQRSEQKAEESLKKSQELASSIDGMEVSVRVRANDRGELYAALGAEQVREAFAREGHDVPASCVRFSEPVKQLGEHPVTIALDHGLEVQIKAIVEPAIENIGNTQEM